MGRIVVIFLALTIFVAGCLGGDEEDISFYGREYNPAVDAPDFTMTDQDGNSVTLSDFEGKVVVVAFIYTTCPDVCPAIETNMNYVAQELGDSFATDVVYLSITIDPVRDTSEVLAEYVEHSGFDWPHLTSTDYEMLKDTYLEWGMWVNSSMMDDHVDGANSHSENGHPSSEISHTFSVMYPDNSSTTTAVLASELTPDNGWDLTVAGMSKTGVEFNATNDPSFGHYINNISGIDAPSDWAWWWALNVWNESSSAWEESNLGIDSLELANSPHISWAPSNADLSLLPHPTDDGHSFAVLFPDNSTAQTIVNQDEIPATNGWDLTVAGMQKAAIDFNATNDPSFGHYINNISGIDAASDYSWWWGLFVWNDSSASWQESNLGIDSVELANSPHILWAPSNANVSLISPPDEGNNDENSDSHSGYQVGHSSMTYIIDKNGQKRVAWVGSDWNADEFLADIQALI